MKDIRKPEFMTGISSKGYFPILEILIALVVCFVGSILSSFVQMPALIVYLLGNREYQEMVFSGRVNMEKMMDIILNVPQWITIVILVGELGLMFVVFLYCRFLEKRKLSTLGFRKKGCVTSYCKGILLGMLLCGVAYLICFASGSLTVEEVSVSGETILYVVGFFFGYLIQGMAEEVLCRGYLMVSLSRRCSVTLSVVLSALFFSMLHGMNQGITLLAYVNLFLFGVLLALLFIRCENIWIVGAVHSIWNFVQGSLFGVQVSGMKTQPSIIHSNMTEGWEIINGGAFGMEGGLAVTLVFSVTLGILLYSMKKHGYFVEVETGNAPWKNEDIPPQNVPWGSGNAPTQNSPWESGSAPTQNNPWESGNAPIQNNPWESGSAPSQDISAGEGEMQRENPFAQQGEMGEAQSRQSGEKYENMGLNPEETPWYPQKKKQENDGSMTGFDQSYFKE